ncbi:seminase [Drosophila teissieri]|uniref:seminase n=1 Tax=Drosophila teissieri TaxID=7243 RepID=UPI001CB9ECE9|nr:seminase [Drosophila teissieri]
MKYLPVIFSIALLLADVGIANSSWWNSSATYLHGRPPVKTVNKNGFRMTQGDHAVPWLLRIMDGPDFACGASYLSALYALTSANCMHFHRSQLDSLSVELVTSGNWQETQDNMNDLPSAQIRNIFVSKDWHWPGTFMDVAVIELTNRLRGSRNDFVTLCTNPLSTYKSLSVVSYGARPMANVRTEEIEVLNRMICDSAYGNYLLRESIACAKELKRSSECMFTPGCPVTSGDQLCGIVAWGPACKRPGLPGIFTDIHHVRRFILKVTGKKQKGSSHSKAKWASKDVPEWHSGFWLSR